MGNVSMPGQTSGGGGFLRLVAMVPVLMLSNKLDFTDQSFLTRLRLIYFAEQLLLFIVLRYLYKKTEAANDHTVIYVRKPPSFTDPRVRYDKTTYKAFEKVSISVLVQQTILQIAMTLFLHLYVGIRQSILLQTLMAPMTFGEHGLVRKYIFGTTARHFEEKFEGEEREEEDVVITQPDKRFEEDHVTEEEIAEVRQLIADTWNAHDAADIPKLVASLHRGTVNTIGDNDASALMVISATEGDMSSYIKIVIGMGADVLLVDGDGWSALHWAVFHANIDSVKTLLDPRTHPHTEELLAGIDTNGDTALSLARGEHSKLLSEFEELTIELTGKGELDEIQLERKEEQVSNMLAIKEVLERASDRPVLEEID